MQPTYKELKLEPELDPEDDEMCLQPTYKELKLVILYQPIKVGPPFAAYL